MLKFYYSSSPLKRPGRQPKSKKQPFTAMVTFRNDDDCLLHEMSTREAVTDFIKQMQSVIAAAEDTLRYPELCISSDRVQPVTGLNDLF